MHSIEREVKRNVGDGKYKFFKSINLISNDLSDLAVNEYCELTFEFLQFKIHWNLKSDYENEMFYEKCKTGLIAQRNNFNHSLRKCFHNFQFKGYEKESVKETKDKSIADVLSDGIYLLTMFFLIIYLFPFFVYVYLNLFHEKKTFTENNDIFSPQKVPENLHEIQSISVRSLDL